MTRVLHRPHAAEASIPCATAPRRPAPAVRPLPGIAAEVLFDLRADDARDTSFAAARALLSVPMHDPAEDPQPIAALVDRARHVMSARHREQNALSAEAMRRRDDIAAATWVDAAIGNEMTECAQAVLDVVAAHPELLADTGLGADVVALALSDLDALLALPLPGSNWATALRAVMPMGQVA